jgi:hypothetical protein
MSEQKQQNFKNHVKLDPAFHFFMVPVALITLGIAIHYAATRKTLLDAWMVVLSMALLVAFFQIRIYSLKVQDRVIRLEETLRMQRVLPEALKTRIGTLTKGQMVALRFASDAEVSGLVEKALANGWKGKEIKQAIVNWRPDYFRV